MTDDISGGSELNKALLSFKLILANPFSRFILKRLLRKYKINGKEFPALYWALSLYAGETLNCPITLRFLSSLLGKLLDLGIRLAKGEPEEVKEALLKDPRIRRGIWVVLEGIARYGVTVPQKLSAPFLIVWNFTNMCNFRCLHCYQRASAPLPTELSLEEKLRVIDQLDRAGVAAVALSGGEPTLHPDFLRVVSELASRGIYTSLATNGWVFADKEKMEKAVKAGLNYIEVSIDSAKPEKHDSFRRVPGAWERAIRALENAVELGVSNGMATIMSRDTLYEIDDILDLAENIGVERVIFFNFIPTGRAKDIAHNDLTPEEREEFLKILYNEMKRRKLIILSTAPEYARVTLQLSHGEEVSPAHFYIGKNEAVRVLAEFIGGCGAGRIYAGLEPDGTVVPCVFLPIPVGNLRTKDFSYLWRHSKLFNLLRDRENFTGNCRNCPYRNVCGGCRARAYHYTLDVLGDDPGCILNKDVWERILRGEYNKNLSEFNWVEGEAFLRRMKLFIGSIREKQSFITESKIAALH
ncbi:MAG: radical SAM/SPASM domain-containing protein [Thermoprotei archaeon]|nr:MAG: radical SAM/SPASM domain-containing protein [Thermoprotei archaeon]